MYKIDYSLSDYSYTNEEEDIPINLLYKHREIKRPNIKLTNKFTSTLFDE